MKRQPHLHLAAALFVATVTACPPASTAVDAGLDAGTPLPSLLFGLNVPWSERGGGIATSGELLRDRCSRAWSRSNSGWSPLPNGGTVTPDNDGDPLPAAGAGSLRLERSSAGLTCAIQRLTTPPSPGPLALSLSLKGLTPGATVQREAPAPFARLIRK